MAIHIKPENRGKFNATKKRTGKTTEQLTHSKNPLTRKRAIFAQNAKKWKHADGGNLFYNGGPDGDPRWYEYIMPSLYIGRKAGEYTAKKLIERQQRKAKEAYAREVANRMTNHTLTREDRDYLRKNHPEIWNAYTVHDDTYNIMDDINDRMAEGKATAADSAYLKKNFPLVYNALTLTPKDSEFDGTYGYKPYIEEFDARDSEFDGAYNAGLKEANKKANGGNLFNWGGGTLTGQHMDYGLEWNNKIDRLRAYNKMISEIGQKASSMASAASGYGISDPEGIKADASKDLLNNQYQKLDQLNKPDFGNAATKAGQLNNDWRTTTLNTYNNMNSSTNPAYLGYADGGQIQLGINAYKYNPPKERGNGFENVINGLGINSMMQDMQTNPQQTMSTFGNMQQFGQNFGNGFKNMFNGAGGAAAAPKACGGALFDRGGFVPDKNKIPNSLMMMNDPMYYGNTMYPEYVDLVAQGKTKEATKSSKKRDKRGVKEMGKAAAGLWTGSGDIAASVLPYLMYQGTDALSPLIVQDYNKVKEQWFGDKKACGGKLHCGGGNLFDYGGDFSNGQTMYNTGGTHEENPYEGVQVGNDNQGTPNLVEEGEVRYRDYIFSNRLSLSPELAEKYNIPKKYRDATFAYIAEKMGEESREREYDPISQRGLKTDMEKLRAAQEEARAIKAQEEQMQQAQQIANELGVSVEDVLSAMQMQQEEAAQQQMMAQQQPSPEEMQMMQQQQMMQEQPSEEEMAAMEMQERMPQEAMPIQGYALGGTLFDYPNYNPSNPQPYSTLFDNYANVQNVNKFDDGTTDVNNPWYSALVGKTYGNDDLTDWLYGDGYNWITPWGESGYVATTPSFDDRHYKFARSAEKEEADAVYQKFTQAILDNPELREWYFKQYDAATPGKSVRTKFYDKDGNLRKDWKEHFLELRKDNKIGPMHNIARRLGTRYFYTDPNGNRVYVENPGINYTTTDRGIVDAEDGINRWHDYEIMKRKADTLPVVNNPTAPKTPQQKIEEGINPRPSAQSTTTSSTNPQSEAQNPNNFNQGRISPNYSMFDFVPLWQYLTAGKPDYTQPDSLVDYTNRLPNPTYKPIGDFLQYHPFDRQYAANQQNAKTAAMIRNNWNTSGGNRGYAGAMNLATNMQGQLADAEMQRQADASNLAQRAQVATFNRGTNQYNADAFNRLQLSLPQMYNLGLQARSERARQHYMIDKDFGTSKSANLNTWLKNMYARQREAEDAARTKWLADAGVFGELKDPGYPYPINGNNSFLDWFGVNWRKFGKNNNNNIG